MGSGDVRVEDPRDELFNGSDELVDRRLGKSVPAKFDPEIGVIFIHPSHFNQVMKGPEGPEIRVYFTSRMPESV